MRPGLSEQDLIHAYTLLFCPDKSPSVTVLNQLSPESLQAAFKKKALQTHPDRSRFVGKAAVELNERFKEVSHAYEILKHVIRRNPASRSGKRARHQNNQMDRSHPVGCQHISADHFYTGLFPKKKLLIGQFLYYAGIISWRTLIKAIVWQRTHRPPIGQIALNWGILTLGDIERILKEKSLGKAHPKRFGEYALWRGYITAFEHMALLGKQRKLQRPIGQYFVDNHILLANRLERLIQKQKTHNQLILRLK